MMINKFCFLTAATVVAATFNLSTARLQAENASDSDRLEKLERAVQQLQERNSELEAEVKSLKSRNLNSPAPPAEGPTKTVVTSDGKSYVEKSVPIEKSASDKWKLSLPIMQIELFGDARLRYEYRAGESVSDAPVAAPGAGIAARHDWQERERERYRLRLGLHVDLANDWFAGVRLETSQNPRSTNVTFGDDTSGSSSAGNNGPFSKVSDSVNVGQAYIGYKGFKDFTFMGGKMPMPLVTTLMVWDGDINPEGLSEQWKHTFTFGGGGVSPGYSKDGKSVASSSSEPFLKLDLFANFAQFVYDDANPENPLGLRSTTTANGSPQRVPNTDAFLLAWQTGARFTFPKTLYAQVAPVLYNYTGNGDTFNVHYQGGDPTLTNALSFAQNQTGINSLLILETPWEVGWKLGSLPMRLFGDFAVNFDGDERALAAGHPGKGDQRYAYQVGAGVGQLKKRGDWQVNVFYQRQDQYSLDPNLVDTEFWDTQLNLGGVGVTGGYMLSDAVWLGVLYGYAWRADHDLGTGGVGADIALNPNNRFQIFQLDLNVKF